MEYRGRKNKIKYLTLANFESSTRLKKDSVFKPDIIPVMKQASESVTDD